MKLPSSSRVLALAVVAYYVTASTRAGGPGGFLVAAIVVGTPLILIWYGEEVGRALAWEAEGFGQWFPGVLIRSLGWLILLWMIIGYVLKAPGRI